jgi:hypothetical protein
MLADATSPLGRVRCARARTFLLRLLWLGTAALALAAPSVAQAPRRVVLFSTGSAALAEQLRVQLNRAGFSAQVQQEASTLEGALRMRESAAQEGAELAVTLRLLDDRVELTIYDLKRDRGFVHELPATSAKDEQALAEGVAELVRTSPVSDVSIEGSASPGAQAASRSAQPSPVVEAATPPKRSYAGFGLGLATLGGPGGYGASLALSLDAGAYVIPALRLGAFVLFPVTARHIAVGGVTGTRTTTRFTPFGGEARWNFRRDARLRPSLAGGFSAVICVIEGRTLSSGFVERRSQRWSTGVFLRPGLSYHVTRIFSVRSDFTLGVQFSSFALRSMDETLARWGKPWFAGSIAFDISLP